MGPGRRAFTRPFRQLRAALAAREGMTAKPVCPDCGLEVPARLWGAHQSLCTKEAAAVGDATTTAEGSDGLPPAA